MDNLSQVHFKAVWSEIQGRFFTQEEANELKAAVQRGVVTDPQIRAEAAKVWSDDGRQ
jgi:hypothetical protein